MSDIVDCFNLHFINAYLFERRTCGAIYTSENVQAKLGLTMGYYLYMFDHIRSVVVSPQTDK